MKWRDLKWRDLLFAAAAVVTVLLFVRPASPWEFDEPLFFQALSHYDPVAHHPPPPGYPVFMFVGKLVRLVAPTDFAALVSISIAASAIAFVLFAIVFANLSGDLTAGIAGAILFYFSPAMLVYSTLPLSDPGALAMLAAAMFFFTSGRSPAAFAAFAALAVGWRIQFSIFVVPFLLVSVLLMKSWRDRAIVLGVFTLVCLTWLTPLTLAVGGPKKLIQYETGQAAYFTEHDAGESRSGWTPSRIAFRFIAHPWGTKLESFPLLLVSALGLLTIVQRREQRVVPFAVAAACYLAFALAVMDPADGARYAIPFTLFVAFGAGVGLSRAASIVVGTEGSGREVITYVAAGLFAGGGLVYVSKFLSQRSTSPSPPVVAAEYARSAFPSNAVALYELPLWPHSQYFLADRSPIRVNEGLNRYFDRPEVPLFIYADGTTSVPGARTFQWEPSDAYSKLTRNHYRVVSIIPVPPERRFKVIRGGNTTEREPDGEEWRWLSSPAELQLPRGGWRRLTIRLGLPKIYPMEANTLDIEIDGTLRRTVRLKRGEPVDVKFDVLPGAPVIRFVAAKSFVPAAVPGSLNRDPRRLSVKLYDLRATSFASVQVPQAVSQ